MNDEMQVGFSNLLHTADTIIGSTVSRDCRGSLENAKNNESTGETHDEQSIRVQNQISV